MHQGLLYVMELHYPRFGFWHKMAVGGRDIGEDIIKSTGDGCDVDDDK